MLADLLGRTTGREALWGVEPGWSGEIAAFLEAARDPANAPAMRPHVVAPCQQLPSHPALRLHCTCGRGLDYLALASFSTGVLVVSSPRRVPLKRREGGTRDLAPVGDDRPEAIWTLSAWEASMRQRAASHATGWKPEPHPALGNAVVMGDTAKRQVFHCKGCGATHVFLNVTLLRLLLEAIAAGSQTVRLAGPAGTSHAERPESARVAQDDKPAPLPMAARRHICTIWCSGDETSNLPDRWSLGPTTSSERRSKSVAWR